MNGKKNDGKTGFQPLATQTNQEMKKVNSVKELIETQNSKMTYAVIKDRNNVIISLTNKNGLIKVNIVTALDQKFASGFRAEVIERVIEALKDLNTELQMYRKPKEQNLNVKVY
jgi:phosphopantetheine adenylyltransferase